MLTENVSSSIVINKALGGGITSLSLVVPVSSPSPLIYYGDSQFDWMCTYIFLGTPITGYNRLVKRTAATLETRLATDYAFDTTGNINVSFSTAKSGLCSYGGWLEYQCTINATLPLLLPSKWYRPPRAPVDR